MKVTGIWALPNRNVQTLLGEQRQCVWIAMALARGTKILRLIQMLNKRFGITILTVLHDLNQAIQYGNEIVALPNKDTIVT